MAEITPEEKWQKIEKNLNSVEKFDPQFVSEFYINNLVQHSYSHIHAYKDTEERQISLEADVHNALKVNDLAGSIVDHVYYENVHWSFPTGQQQIAFECDRIYFIVSTRCNIEFTDDKGNNQFGGVVYPYRYYMIAKRVSAYNILSQFGFGKVQIQIHGLRVRAK